MLENMSSPRLLSRLMLLAQNIEWIIDYGRVHQTHVLQKGQVRISYVQAL